MTAVSVRSYLAAGLAAAAVGGAAVTPLPGSARVELASPAVALTAALTDLVQPVANVSVDAKAIVPTASNPITNAYDRLEPWAAYGADLAQWALSWVPGLWWVAPGIDLAYYSIEPLVQASVFSVSYVLFLQLDQIPQAISNGIQESIDNFVTYGYQWLASLVPLPPIPPLPPRPPFSASAVKSPLTRVASATRQGAPEVAPATGTALAEAAAPEVPAPSAVVSTAAKPAAARAVRAARGVSSTPVAPAAADAPAAEDASAPTAAADVSATSAEAKAPVRRAHRAARTAD